MSIVLDALQRGRGKQVDTHAASAAQADAVLRTMGYGRIHQVSRLKQISRVGAALAAGVLVGIVLWTAVVWLTRAYLQRASATDEAAAAAIARIAVPATLSRASLVAGEGGARTPEAISQLQQAIAIDPQNVRARNRLGIVYLDQGRREEAAAQFHSAHVVDPKDAASLVNLSAVEMASGRRDEARRWVLRALQIDPRSAEAHYNVALLNEHAGNLANARHHYREFLRYGADAYPSLAMEVRRRSF
jgi:tetratricopeptide (TPR) repeat protein